MTTSQPAPKHLYHDILCAAMLLTRIPIRGLDDASHETARSYWAFPLIGLLVAAIPALLAGLLLPYGLPPLAAAMLTLAGVAVLTGGLHLDGLADTADGFGGKDAKNRLKIMRDSGIGGYGAFALISISIISASCLAAIAADGGLAMMQAMISAAALSRAMIAVQRHLNAPPDETGLASMTGRPSGMITVIAVLTAMVISVGFSGAASAIMLVLAGIAVTVLLGRFLVGLIGGVNGDGLGATQQVSEAVMLIILAITAA